MRKIILKTAFFVSPFIILHLITATFYFSSLSDPDLLRVGYLPFFKEYRSVFQKEFERKTYFNEISKSKNKKAKILIMGDSFSGQGNYGYKNYLAEKHSVLHLDTSFKGNRLQILYEFLNSDFFEEYEVEYVVLENVERKFVYNSKKIDVSKTRKRFEFNKTENNHKTLIKKEKGGFFSRETISFPFSMFRFYLDENYLSKNVYNVNLKTNKLFSNNSSKLLFSEEDMLGVQLNNNLEGVIKLNNVLNDLSKKLREKEVKLIVLPAPDKYDLYYDYILDKTNFPKPLFFQYLGSLKKDYIYIDSKRKLLDQLEFKKDIYFYDDTHWSPVASKIIANEIDKVVN